MSSEALQCFWWAPHALAVSAPPAKDVLITIKDGKIAALEANVSRKRALALGASVHDECVIAPGFVNAHAHIEYAAYEALVDGLSFTEWIVDHAHRKRRLSAQQMQDSAELGACQAAQAGITTIGDASFSGAAAHAIHKVGLRARVYLEVFGGSSKSDAAQVVERALEKLDELPTSQLLNYGLSPHAPYTASLDLYKAVKHTGMHWMSHMLESYDELLWAQNEGELFSALVKRGIPASTWKTTSPLEQIYDLLDERSVLVHMVEATPTQLEHVAQRGAAIAHCPRSNAWLGCGRFDLERADRAGVVVGLGTDSPASAGPLDPFALMRSTLEMHRAATKNSDAPSLSRILKLATLDAAQLLDIDHVGSLDVGSWADLVALHVGPCDDPLAAYVLAGTPANVREVLVAGKVVAKMGSDAVASAREKAREARTLLALPVPRTGRVATVKR